MQLCSSLPSLLVFFLFTTQVLQCKGFILQRNLKLGDFRWKPESTFRLQNMILILEDDEGNEDEDNDNKNIKNESQIQKLRSALRMSPLSSPELQKGYSWKPMRTYIESWKEKLKNNSDAPFTTMQRVRLEKEIALLEQLEFSNDAAVELSNLWINERGPNGANALRIAQTLTHVGAWKQAEAILVLMIEEEGVHFLAPISQLATVLQMQGQLQESKELHELVLQQKPWFTSSLLGIHSVCRKLDDQKELVKWDSELIPPLENKSQRQEWVRRMVKLARVEMGEKEEELPRFFDCDGGALVETPDSWQ